MVVETRNPSDFYEITLWYDASYAFVSDDLRAYGTPDALNPYVGCKYRGYGFNIPLGSTIQKVEMGGETKISGFEFQLFGRLSPDNGNTWTPWIGFTQDTSDYMQWIDMTFWLASGWTPEKVNAIESQIGVVRTQAGGGGGEQDLPYTGYLDWFPIRVTYVPVYRFVQNLSVIRDVFSFVYTPIVVPVVPKRRKLLGVGK